MELEISAWTTREMKQDIIRGCSISTSMVSRTQGSGFVLDIRLPQLLLQRLFTHLDWGQLPSSRANQALARISGCITPYVYASLKGSQSSCTTMGPSCSSKTASTPSGFQEAVFQPFVWTLVDLDECKEGVPPHLVGRLMRLFVIYTTSPRNERWSRPRVKYASS